jgi:hypothetical protein
VKKLSAERATADQIAWAGRVWDRSLRRDCEAFYWLASGYPDTESQVAMLVWEHLGEAIQNEIALNLSRLEASLQKAHRT